MGAEELIFVGYSMPITDIAATFLFTEPLASRMPNVLVDLGNDPIKQGELESRYKNLLPKSVPIQFENEGALKWVTGLANRNQ